MGVTLGSHQATRQQWQNSCGDVVLDTFLSIGGDHGPSDALFNATYVVPFLGLDQAGAVDPEIAKCGVGGMAGGDAGTGGVGGGAGGMSGGAGGMGAGGAIGGGAGGAIGASGGSSGTGGAGDTASGGRSGNGVGGASSQDDAGGNPIGNTSSGGCSCVLSGSNPSESMEITILALGLAAAKIARPRRRKLRR
jgi:hypothetical protein